MHYLLSLRALVTILFIVATGITYAADTAVFGPEKFTRGSSKPESVTRLFSVPNPQDEFTLVVTNGDGKRGRISSALITLNGTPVVQPNAFNKNVDALSLPIQLRAENRLDIDLRSAPGASLIVTVIGPATPTVSPFAGVALAPDAIFVNEPRNVSIRAAVPYDPALSAPLVRLWRVDAAGNYLAAEGELTDDGNISNGDEIAGDGVFSARKLFASQTEERIRLRLELERDGVLLKSPVFFLDVFTHLTEQQLITITSLQASLQATYNALASTVGTKKAQQSVLAQLQGDPNILQSGVSDSANGVWMLFSSGVLGALNLNTAGTRGGLGPLFQSTPSMSTVALAAQGSNEAGNRKAIILAPFLNIDPAFTPDETPAINEILTKSTCPQYDVTYLTHAAVTVDIIKTLHAYGIVAIATHGDTYYKGLLSLWEEKFGWNGFFGQVIFLTGQTATTANQAAYEIDLKKGRLAIASGHYAILPTFIRHYSSSAFPDSLVYIGACRSTFNNTMASAFRDSGAKTFLGYSKYVDGNFATSVGTTFFKRWIEDPNDGFVTAGQSFTAGQCDSSTPAACFTMSGATALTAPSADQLADGGFETGSLGAWTASGDGRVVSQLGQFNPQEGAYLGLISTGLGLTTSSGAIEQKVCLPAKAQRLEFSWNFNSEEFIEWCGSQFQDAFRVDVITPTGTQNLFTRRVDDLCSLVTPSTLRFDQSTPTCTPSAGVGYGTGGNDCKVWTTGWRFASIDISGIAAATQGKAVRLRFSATDVGDSIFDSAVLLDKITLTTAP